MKGGDVTKEIKQKSTLRQGKTLKKISRLYVQGKHSWGS